MRRFVGFGESHLIAIRNAARHNSTAHAGYHIVTIAARDFKADMRKTGGVDNALYSEAIRTALAEPTALVFCSLGGGMHATLGRFRSPRPFDIMLPDTLAAQITRGTDVTARISAEAEIIPYALLRQQMERRILGIASFFELVRTAGYRQLVCVLPPPPIGDLDYVAEVTRATNPDVLAEYGLSPSALVFKLWFLLSDIIAEICARHAVTALSAPAESMGEDGYLLPAYYGRDFVHANAAYGELVIKQLVAIDQAHTAGESGRLA